MEDTNVKLREFMFQVSSGYSGRLKAKNYRLAKKYLKKQYPKSEIYLLIDCSKVLVEYTYGKKTFLRLAKEPNEKLKKTC